MRCQGRKRAYPRCSVVPDHLRSAQVGSNGQKFGQKFRLARKQTGGEAPVLGAPPLPYGVCLGRDHRAVDVRVAEEEVRQYERTEGWCWSGGRRAVDHALPPGVDRCTLLRVALSARAGWPSCQLRWMAALRARCCSSRNCYLSLFARLQCCDAPASLPPDTR